MNRISVSYILSSILIFLSIGAKSQENLILFPRQSDLLWGAVDSVGNISVPIIYDFVQTSPFSSLARVYKGNKMGLVAKGGDIIVAPVFDSVTVLNPSYILSWRDSTVDIRNMEGAIERSFFYTDFHTFSKYLFGIENGMEAIIINTNLRKFKEYRFDKLWLLQTETRVFVVFRNNKKYGIINDSLKIIVQPTFDKLRPEDPYFVVYQDNKKGIVDFNGKERLKIEYQKIKRINDSWLVFKDEKYGVLDKNFKMRIPLLYSNINFYKNCWMVLDKVDFGLYSSNYILRLPTEFDRIEKIGKEWHLTKDGKKGLADENFKILQGCNFLSFSKFSDGLFLFESKRGKGLIDIEGKVLIPPEYSRIVQLDSVRFYISKKYLKGIYNIKKGREEIPCHAINIDYYKDRGFIVRDNKGFWIINFNGRYVNTTPFKDIAYIGGGVIRMGTADGFGLINFRGQKILPARYSRISTISTMPFFLIQGNRPKYPLTGFDPQKHFISQPYLFDYSALDTSKYDVSVFDPAYYYPNPDKINVSLQNENQSDFLLTIKDRHRTDKYTLAGICNKFGEVLLDTMFRKNNIVLDAEMQTIKVETDTAIFITNFDDNYSSLGTTYFKNWFNVDVTIEADIDTDFERYIWQKGMDSLQVMHVGLYDNTDSVVVLPYIYDNVNENTDYVDITEINSQKYTMPPFNTIDSVLRGCASRNTGKEVLKPLYANVDLFASKLVRTIAVDGKFGLADSTGRFIFDNLNYIDTEFRGYIRLCKGGTINCVADSVTPINRNDFFTRFLPDCILCDSGKTHIAGGKWGLANTLGNSVLPFEYDYLDLPINERIIARLGDKWGVVNLNQNIIIPFIYSDLKWIPLSNNNGAFAGGYFKFKDKGRWGVVDSVGNVVIEPIYSNIQVQSNIKRLGFLVQNDNYWGLTDKTGKILIKPEYDLVSLLEISDKDYFTIEKNRLVGFATYENGVIMPPTYSNIKQIKQHSGSLAQLSERIYKIDSTQARSQNYFVSQTANLKGIISKKGKLILAPQFTSVNALESRDALFFIGIKNDKSGIYTEKGEQIIPHSFSDISFIAPDETDYFKVLIKSAKYGFIDKTGQMLFDAKFTTAGDYNNGFAFVREYPQEVYYINTTGKRINKDKLQNGKDFSEGLAAVQKDSLWGYIDTTGVLSITPEYNYCGNFVNGVAFVEKYRGKQKKQAFINKEGKILYRCRNKNVHEFTPEGLASISKMEKTISMKIRLKLARENKKRRNARLEAVPRRKKTMLLNSRLKTIAKGDFEEWSNFNQYGLLRVHTKSGKALVYNKKGKNILRRIKASRVDTFVHGCARVQLENLYSFVDTLGRQSPFLFGYLTNLNEGVATYKYKGLYGFCTYDSILVKPKFAYAGKFKEGRSIVVYKTDTFKVDKLGNRAKNKITAGGYRNFNFKHGAALIKTSDDTFNYINSNGYSVFKNDFTVANEFNDSIAIAKQGKWCILLSTGKYMIEPVIDDLFAFSCKRARYSMKYLLGVYNTEGKLVAPVSAYEIEKTETGAYEAKYFDRIIKFSKQ